MLQSLVQNRLTPNEGTVGLGGWPCPFTFYFIYFGILTLLSGFCVNEPADIGWLPWVNLVRHAHPAASLVPSDLGLSCTGAGGNVWCSSSSVGDMWGLSSRIPAPSCPALASIWMGLTLDKINSRAAALWLSVHGETKRLGKGNVYNKGIKLHDGNIGVYKEKPSNTENYTFLHLSLKAVYWLRLWHSKLVLVPAPLLNSKELWCTWGTRG